MFKEGTDDAGGKSEEEEESMCSTSINRWITQVEEDPNTFKQTAH